MILLDDKFVKNCIRIPEKRYKIYDDALLNNFFYLRVSPKGKIVACVKWTMASGERREKTLGEVNKNYPMMSTYRSRAKNILSKLIESNFEKDPFDDNPKDSRMMFRDLVKKWKISTFPEKAETTIDTETRLLRNDILPHFSKKPQKLSKYSLDALLEMDSVGNIRLCDLDYMKLSELKSDLKKYTI